MFVHARNGTVKTAIALKEMAAMRNEGEVFWNDETPELGNAQKQVIYMITSNHLYVHEYIHT